MQVNTGGTVAAVTPAVWLKIAPGAWLNTALQLPVFTHLFGDQRVGPTVTAACEYTFGGS